MFLADHRSRAYLIISPATKKMKIFKCLPERLDSFWFTVSDERLAQPHEVTEQGAELQSLKTTVLVEWTELFKDTGQEL